MQLFTSINIMIQKQQQLFTLRALNVLKIAGDWIFPITVNSQYVKHEYLKVPSYIKEYSFNTVPNFLLI